MAACIAHSCCSTVRNGHALHELTRELLKLARSWPEARKVRWSIDVDPAEL